jgi:hypothetical protein
MRLTFLKKLFKSGQYIFSYSEKSHHKIERVLKMESSGRLLNLVCSVFTPQTALAISL